MIVPAGLAAAPACPCPACAAPLARDGGPIQGRWHVTGCCAPSGSGGTWSGPPRDPAACERCFGTRRRSTCAECALTNCDGDHHGECVACDATGSGDCPACNGDGHVFDAHGQDTGLCPSPGCTAGRGSCKSCGGSGKDGGRR